jgi:hypothetical protein
MGTSIKESKQYGEMKTTSLKDKMVSRETMDMAPRGSKTFTIQGFIHKPSILINVIMLVSFIYFNKWVIIISKLH